MEFIKNIRREEVLSFADEVTVQKGQIISKTLAQNDALSLTLFAFGAGEEISTHKSEGDALVLNLEGKARITIDGTEYRLSEGDSILMPAGKPHAVFAEENFKMFLVVVFPKDV
jgi:quercetin dioxygenase-like cupin family protein